MGKRSSVIILLCVLTMNVVTLCQSLCLEGHKDMVNPHTSHKTARHEIPKGNVCPVSHMSGHQGMHSSHPIMPETFIRCGCSIDHEASLDYGIILQNAILDLTPHFKIISTLQLYTAIFISSEPIPLEGPPKILA